MSIPKGIAEKIGYLEGHVVPWTDHAIEIGTSAAAVTAWAAKVAAARAALLAQGEAYLAAEAATNHLHLAVDAMSLATSDIIKQIRTQAALTGDGMYTMAQIPAPATPGPVGAPGTPTDMKVTLKPNGSIEMTWVANNPKGCNGVIYQVYRKVAATGEYMYLGGAGQRKFVDNHVPAGVPSVLYQIQGTRSTAVGDAAEFVVNFGVTPSGTVTATVGSLKGTAAKIAA